MKKGLVQGFILGFLTFCGLSFAVTSYNALVASFPIFINEDEWETDKPIVVIEGSTYLPLRAMGEVLGVNINWNEELRRVEVKTGDYEAEETPVAPTAPKEVIQKALSAHLAFYSGNPDGILKALGFNEYGVVVGTDGEQYVHGNSVYTVTTIDYDEFVEKVLEYVSENYFEANLANWFVPVEDFFEVDNNLAIPTFEGDIGAPQEIKTITQVESGEDYWVYKVTSRPANSDVYAQTLEYKVTLVEGDNGNFVVERIEY